jgi:hypothetical protein
MNNQNPHEQERMTLNGDSTADRTSTLSRRRKQKQQVIRVLGSLSDHEWVVSILNKYKADKDEDIQYEAERALEKTHTNAVNAAQMREAYQKRSKE